jgi:hypothetical protein
MHIARLYMHNLELIFTTTEILQIFILLKYLSYYNSKFSDSDHYGDRLHI